MIDALEALLEYGIEPPYRDGCEPLRILKPDLDYLLTWATEIKASDIIFQPGEPPVVVYRDETVRVMKRLLSTDEVNDILVIVTSPDAPARLKGANDIPFSWQVKQDRLSTLRYRGQATAIQSPSGMDSAVEVVFRTMPAAPPTVDEIGLPPEIVDAALAKDGLMLVTGPTGSGKTTTLAAILRKGLETKPGRRLICYEHPVEFDYYSVENRQGTVAQSQVGEHVHSFQHGVTIALRRKPARILFGEIRDVETIEGAFVAAQTGHAVYGTLHTNSVPAAVPRMVNEFPAASRWAMARNIIDSSRLIMHQRLTKSSSGSLLALREYLIFTEAVRARILSAGELGYVGEMAAILRENRTRLIDDVKDKHDAGLLSEQSYLEFRQQYAAELTALAAEAGPGARFSTQLSEDAEVLRQSDADSLEMIHGDS